MNHDDDLNNNQSNHMKFVLEETTAKFYTSIQDLVHVLSEVFQSSGSDSNCSRIQQQRQQQLNLPTEILHDHIIIPYLVVIDGIDHANDVTAVGCSSIYYTESMLQRHYQKNDNRNSKSSSGDKKTSLQQEQEKEHERLALLQHCLTDDETTWWISSDDNNNDNEDTDTDALKPQYVDFCVCSSNSRDDNSNSNTNHIQMLVQQTQQKVKVISSTRLRRLHTISIKIPPLPFGPMSVREFYIQRSKHHNYYCSNSNNKNDGGNISNNNTSIVEWETIPSTDYPSSITTPTPPFILDPYRTDYQTFRFDNASYYDVRYIRIVCVSNQISHVHRFSTTPQSRIAEFIPKSVGFYSIRFE